MINMIWAIKDSWPLSPSSDNTPLFSHTAPSEKHMEAHVKNKRNTDLCLTPWASWGRALHFTVLQCIIGNVWDKLLRSKGDQTDSKEMKKKNQYCGFYCLYSASMYVSVYPYLAWKKQTTRSDREFIWSHLHFLLPITTIIKMTVNGRLG